MIKTIIKELEVAEILLRGWTRQVILTGPPGTSKTYSARRIIGWLIGENMFDLDNKSFENKLNECRFGDHNNGNVIWDIIQFHPSYNYEDFVRGITVRSEEGKIIYETRDKILGRMAKEAAGAESGRHANKMYADMFMIFRKFLADSNNFGSENFNDIDDENLKIMVEDLKEYNEIDAFHKIGKLKEIYEIYKEFVTNIDKDEKKYILVVDEINRAPLAAVLGELIYALEYRGEGIKIPYEIDGDSTIKLPDNLYIIGTMNTADRSIGSIDYAVRRRFAFISFLPDEEVIDFYYDKKDKNLGDKAKKFFGSVKDLFVDENNLAPDFYAEDVQIGHTYFLAESEEELKYKFVYQVIPILKEYMKDGIFKNNLVMDVDGEKLDLKKSINEIAEKVNKIWQNI